MTDPGVRLLFQPGRESASLTNTVPKRSSDRARETLGQFLDAQLIRPLYFNDEMQAQRVEDALDTMTLAERITIEIEMQNRNAVVHSFDYDPFAAR
jgi:hypothetical protein